MSATTDMTGRPAQATPDEDAPHILIVDDDRRIRELLQRYLAEHGYRISAAENAGEARAKLAGLAFDLIVLDVMMPGESGLDFAASLRRTSSVPILMLTAPIPATRKVLEKAGMTIEQMDLLELNEAFASVVLAWEKAMGADHAKVNVNGGAVALGHPLGASGARITTMLLNELERSGGRFGLQTICEGGGTANAMIIERI